MSERVYIGLGSNLENPKQQIQQAIEALKALPESNYLETSGLYQSKPLPSDEEQPDYCNAVAVIETALEPLELLERLQAIENSQGRLRVARWGARTLDLDILLYGQQRIHDKRLQVPHADLCRREFVLYPLQELNPDLVIPGRGMLEDIISECPLNGMQYLGALDA